MFWEGTYEIPFEFREEGNTVIYMIKAMLRRDYQNRISWKELKKVLIDEKLANEL